MSRSLNEVEATARKAARGAGYQWGLAEEAGKAARWLCAHGLDGCRALAVLLRQVEGVELEYLRPAPPDWAARDLPLCPIITGAALSDFADALETSELTVGPLLCPELILPMAAGAAAQMQRPVRVAWQGCTALLSGDGSACVNGAPGDFAVAQITVCLGDKTPDADALPDVTRAAPSREVWAELERFAARTYAPATEESRALGAGSGLNDND